MDAPTPDQLRAQSALLTERYPKATDGADEQLELFASVTSILVGSLTGREIGGFTSENPQTEDVPAAMVPLAIQCVAMKTEQLVLSTATGRDRKRSINRGNLASFSAGSYSESYFGPEQAMRSKQLDSDSVFSQLLWALCTEAMKLYWLSFWEPDAYPQGVASIEAFEYGNRPNYSPGNYPFV